MKIKMVGPFVCLMMLYLPSTSFASTPSTRNARAATFREINVVQTSGERIPKYEENEIHCNRLTSIRYHCSFDYYSILDVDLGCVGGTRGYSYVTFDRYGAEVRLHLDPNKCVENRED
jgi:hypothetical protein